MSRLDASAYLAHLRSTGQAQVELSSTVLLALHPAARARRTRTERSAVGAVQRQRRGIPICTVQPHGPGAAVAAMTVDLMAAQGVREIIGVGIASLIERGDEAVPRAVMVHEAHGDDSVTHRYGGQANADPMLTQRLGEHVDHASHGNAFSTAVPFRVDQAAAAASGAAVIDMEAAAFFAASNAAGIAAALVVVPSDVTGAASWRPLDPRAVAESVGAIANRIRSAIVEEG